MKKLYKVVKRHYRSGGYMSARYGHPKMLEYEIGCVTTAPKSSMGIFCFKSRPDAEAFRVSDEYILEVEPVGFIHRIKFMPMSIDAIENFLRNRRWKKSIGDLKGVSTPPSGTVCVDAVKVLKLSEG
jgi:hypothetical protein